MFSGRVELTVVDILCESNWRSQMTVHCVNDNIQMMQKLPPSFPDFRNHWGSSHHVTVVREHNTSLGISIVWGKLDTRVEQTDDDSELGIFVKNVIPNSSAGKTGFFKTGDKIIEVNGVNLEQTPPGEVIKILRNPENPVTFLMQSLNNRGMLYENTSEYWKQNGAQPEEAVESQKMSIFSAAAKNYDRSATPLQDVTYSSASEDDDDDQRLLEGRTVSAAGQQIDRASAGNVRRTKEEILLDPEEEDPFGYTRDKVRKKYANLGHSILMVHLERKSQGLGLSLAGHRDRNCMAVFVCGLNPKGFAFKNGEIQVGDEILEVNGIVLHGRCHLNASAIIKGISGPTFKIIILRRKSAIEDIAVKPITQFPVSLIEEASEEAFCSNYPYVHSVVIKKGGQSLGIMIIEGKHAEVGQGIFISDIQEGSVAEKAGLEIGEMILAVNKDTLVGANYNTAASLLKRTEGLVTLIVSNPSKIIQASNGNDAGSNTGIEKGQTKLSAALSRPPASIPEPPIDPAICPINSKSETVIEISTENKGLGVIFIGGRDMLIPSGIVLLEVLPGGMAHRDGRLHAGDEIVDVMGTSMKDAPYTVAQLALRQALPKMRITVFRPERVEYTSIEIELIKKPGKSLGLSIVEKKTANGVFIKEIVTGGLADIDGTAMRGDMIESINGQNVENSKGEEIGAILKTFTGKVSLKLKRLKPTALK